MIFAVSLVVLPISSYFLSVEHVWRPLVGTGHGNNRAEMYAGLTAAFVANAVLIGYVVVACFEDASTRSGAPSKSKKTQ